MVEKLVQKLEAQKLVSKLASQLATLSEFALVALKAMKLPAELQVHLTNKIGLTNCRRVSHPLSKIPPHFNGHNRKDTQISFLRHQSEFLFVIWLLSDRLKCAEHVKHFASASRRPKIQTVLPQAQ